MPKQHRKSYNELGHAHELTFSCQHGYPFLGRERTCEWLANSINEARESLHFSLWAYVFMPNHVHLVIHFGRSTYRIAEVLQQIKQPVSRKALAFLRKESPEWLPKLRQARGRRIEYHFWQRGGGYDRNITDEKTLLRMIDYIHLNPVRKALIERPEEWKWSSAGWFAGDNPNTLPVDRIPVEWSFSE